MTVFQYLISVAVMYALIHGVYHLTEWSIRRKRRNLTKVGS